MGYAVEGGIKQHLDLERFVASASDVAAKDQLDLMARCWFSLTANRTDPIEHSFVNPKTKSLETVRITGGAEYGIATIHDQDLIIFVISQWIEAKRSGLEPTRRFYFTPYQFFAWMNKAPQGTAYQRLREALHRLKTTNIETTIRSENKSQQRKNRVKQFSWISEWELTEENGKIRGVEVVLAEWLFESIRDFHVLTLDKRYFDISGSVERWLYLYARKATGGPNGVWSESFRSLYKKSASEGAYKHYASRLRKLVNKNDLPGLRLEKCASVSGEDMLRMERVEKRQPGESYQIKAAQQLPLIEQSPLEEAWENVLETLRKQLGAPTVRSWLEKLHPLEFDDGVLSYRAPTKFIADTVEAQYGHRLKDAWQSLGYEVKTLRMESGKSAKSAA